ncbi:isopenicillin N synthase family oxygenase [Paraburkholderia sp. CNPSo 3274]|uniref:isopenicillin N synthase family dioxygenase n=1 Tax=unclassified Paraburkholderia TaxID=2615204 RepID=UPI0020B77CFD|nr:MULTISPECIES: 2-oxoglutarate and iron-dependent oxygenase domain-containing protein [unclassified Paraburkholderia]MCP3711297.1 isopenicillin N synthase family oxygenase [Paraburkholderia sp. CNPSo 3274]MCX5540020.1 isopenicillin N synthase family oxygenase [Paraburkholderia sp. CNPSo 3076]
MTTPNDRRYTLTELDKEARMGGLGSETHAREVRIIDLADFEERRAPIADELWAAATDVGFFQLVNHGIDLEQVRGAFEMAQRFFALPERVKAQYPLQKAQNSGWESKAQVRPSTGTQDQKESYQITLPHMCGLWPTEEQLPGFRAAMLAFETQCWRLSVRVLSCFADKLGFARDFFEHAHDPSLPTYQSTLRLLHYYPNDPSLPSGLWRAGAHTDFDCLTLLFQRAEQGGLQLCPGKEMDGQEWTSVEPADEVITCNIGDMLMRWSDDQLPSNFHRVRNPLPHEYQGSRYSLAFFCQANRNVMIEGPSRKYDPISAEDYLRQRVAANFHAMK